MGDTDGAGYRGPTACNAAGITYRQLDYWARTGLVEPSVRGAHGSGSQRLYSFRDILVLKVVKRLLDTGISLQQIRAAVHHLRDRGTRDLAQVTLMSDGVSVYECTSPDEVVDLLAGGQGVFGIALGRVWQEVEGNLAELPAVRAEDGLPHRRLQTSSPAAAPPERPARRLVCSQPDGCCLPAPTRPAIFLGTLINAIDTVRESPRVASAGRRRGNFPATSQAPGPDGTGNSGVTACPTAAVTTEGEPAASWPSLRPHSTGGSWMADFARRHIGPSADEQQRMLEAIGYSTLDELTAAALPPAATAVAAGPAAGPSEAGVARRAARASPAATRSARSMIGLGYYGTVTPGRDPPQRAGEPGLVHRVHAVPAGDLARAGWRRC